MRSRITVRVSLLLVALSTGACRKASAPIVDMTPVSDALRFLAVAIVLGVIVNCIFNNWNDKE